MRWADRPLHPRGRARLRPEWALLTATLLVALAACAPAARVTGMAGAASAQAAPAGTTIAEGMASWYGPGFAGRLTASGEVFDPNELTAAHKTLPFGTRLRVTHLRSGRSVVVRINDRGPFVGDRIIDLSRAAAEAIGLVGSGVGRVRLTQVTGQAGAVRAAVDRTLNTYEVITPAYPVGTLLVLSGLERSDRIVVRVVANEPEANGDVTMLISAELYVQIGPAMIVETE